MADIKYKYAKDENGDVVSIYDLTKESSKLHKYTCIGCGHEVRARALESEKVSRHFYHNTESCRRETYLHQLAKLKIKALFDKPESFCIQYTKGISCDKNDCKYRHSNCFTHEDYTEDLKEQYNTCELEKEVVWNDDKFRADLLLTNKDNPEFPPMLIEIWVEHECEEVKKNSGLRILELKIENEDDIEHLCNSRIFRRDENKVFLHGFSFEGKRRLQAGIWRYVHTPKKGSKIEMADCEKPNTAISEKSDLEVNIIDRPDLYEGGFIISDALLDYMDGVYNIKACKYCRQHIYSYDGWTSEHHYFCGKRYSERIDEETCDKFIRNESLCINKSNLRYETVKDTREQNKPYRVYIGASKEFNGDDYFVKKCEYYLSNKLGKEDILIVIGIISMANGVSGAVIAQKYADKYGLNVELHKADWNLHGKSAVYKMIPEITDNLDAAIYFWNGKEEDPRTIIKAAEKKGVHCKILDYSKIEELCPECGGMMWQKTGQYGPFRGCMNYPECKGIRRIIN